MAIIKVKSVKDIPKLKKFKVESTNKLYFQENDYIVKIFLDCYRSLDQKIGKDIFNLLVKLRKLDGESQLILPHDIYMTDKAILGYNTKFINASNVNFISRETKIKELLEAYQKLLESIRLLANNNINLVDILSDNMLYKNGDLYLLDLDLSNIDKNYDSDKLYIDMAYKIWQIILRSIFKYLGDYSLYEVLNHFRLVDFSRGALGCGIISVTESLEEFYFSLQKSLKVDDNTTLLDIDMVLRRINNGY